MTMYSLLIKDRSYPISVYLSYMLRVKKFTRTQAVELMTMAAVRIGIREKISSPANNTVEEWGRSIETPQWAVIASMVILEQFGKTPNNDREWAFWAYAAAARGCEADSYSGTWRDWLDRALKYKTWYEKRGAIRRELKSLKSPNIAFKIILSIKGNGLARVSVANLFANIDQSVETTLMVKKSIELQIPISGSNVEDIISANGRARITYTEIVESIHELEALGVAYHLSNGDINVSWPE